MLQQIIRLDGHIQNIYLAVYPNKLLLLDGCCRPDVPLVLNTIRHILGRELSQLKAVVVTHMHADHAGGATFLQQQTGCKIISVNYDTHWYAGIKGRLSHLLDLSLGHFVAIRQGKGFKPMYYPPRLTPDLQVEDGDSVPMFDDWKILLTQGHTDRDLSVYHVASGKVYVADLIIQLSRNRFVNPYNIHNPSAYKRSLAKIKQLQPKMVMMAHGGQKFVDTHTFDKLIAMTPVHPRTEVDAVKDVVLRVLSDSLTKKKKIKNSKKS